MAVTAGIRDLKTTYLDISSIAAEAFGRPNLNPPNIVDIDNVTLYSFTLNVDRMTIKTPIPSDHDFGPLGFSPVWTNDGDTDDNGRNVRWQLDYQVASEGSVISGSHANSPKTSNDTYTSALGWVEHHAPYAEIAEADFTGEQCLYIKISAINPAAPALTCEPHLIGICLRYRAKEDKA